jgi:aminocarboxymuconate-semialdehyde decarboxylase
MQRRTSIRDAARAAAGIVFTGGVLKAASAQAAKAGIAGRGNVTVGGRRVRTIDVHTHCSIPQPGTQNSSLVLTPERLRSMEQQGIGNAALSINAAYDTRGNRIEYAHLKRQPWITSQLQSRTSFLNRTQFSKF